MPEIREKLIEILRVPIHPHLDADPVEVVADYLIANGVTFATDNNDGCKWIPVSERLPEKSGLVIGCDIVWGVGCFYYHTDMQASAWKQITHWMPLPFPPKEGA